jgi:Mitochondrial carrier protein
MAGGNTAKDHPFEYFSAATVAAIINYPLWRASAIGQSGFKVGSVTIAGRWQVPASLSPYVHSFIPPYKGALATVAGMSWARAAIFWGSDYGRDVLKRNFHASESVATLLPPLVISTLVQLVNMPLVRATITIQDPKSDIPNVYSALKHINKQFGVAGLWHGTSAGVMKTVPKYCTAIVVKDVMETWLTDPDAKFPDTKSDRLWKSAIKSTTAGLAGAVLTNPLDVIRNEMFKTNTSLTVTIRTLYNDTEFGFAYRGMDKNLVAVAIPVACTIFLTDAFIQLKRS